MSEHLEGDLVEGPILCVVIADELPGSAIEELIAHLSERGIEVIVERRARERRSGIERRVGIRSEPERERRLIRAEAGRRIAERRAVLVPVEPTAPLDLPAPLRRYSATLYFYERSEPPVSEVDAADLTRLALAAQAGDAEKASELFQRSWELLEPRFAFALKDHHEAQDLTQDTLERVFEALPRFEFRGIPFEVWLSRIAANLLVSRQRRASRIEVVDPASLDAQARSPEPALSSPAPMSVSFWWVSDEELAQELRKLPEDQQLALELRFLFDLDGAEIARQLERSGDSVRMLIHRAGARLRARLAAREEGSRRHRRYGMLTRMRPAPVLASRRFAISNAPTGHAPGRQRFR